MNEKPRLPSRGRVTPYQATIDQAMQRLERIEGAINASVEQNLRSAAREIGMRRRVVRKGYVANADSVGWHEQNRTDHDWVLKRISLVTDANLAYVLYVGSTDARGIRELFSSGEFASITFPNQTSGYVYSDSFDNDIFVRASEDIFIQASGSANGHLIIATLEIEEHAPYTKKISESEAYAISGTPAPVNPEQAPDVNMTQDPDEFSRHEAPGTIDLLEDDDLSVGPNTQDAVPLIPDAGAHLPAHLR